MTEDQLESIDELMAENARLLKLLDNRPGDWTAEQRKVLSLIRAIMIASVIAAFATGYFVGHGIKPVT